MSSGMMRAAAITLAVAAALGWGWEHAGAAERPASGADGVRVAAQLRPDGRVEVALQIRAPGGGWSERLLPQRRLLPPDAALDRWLWTTPLQLDGAQWRITARRLASGRVEVALQTRPGPVGAWGERVLPARRFLPAVLEPGRWLSSSTVALARQEAQIVSFYGHPGVIEMGALGHGTPAEVAVRVAAWASRYDRLNGARGALPAYHLIAGVAQSAETPDGSWLQRLPDHRIAEYVDAAREHGLLLFLDTQIGWSDPLAEVRRLEPFLREPFVHVALAPEFATRPLDHEPGRAIGSNTGEQVNEVQRYLADLVREEGLPPKILIVHQFTERMLTGRGDVEDHVEVELSIDMDGFGHAHHKLHGYELFALPAPSERPALKLFFEHDTPILTPEEVQGLDEPPDIIIYQ
ncbi:MAG: hypothetical protein F4150_03080 [Chloroflexi bacterium]|nr:hypothetical protein [Chloroflexota bacterium]